MRYEVMEKHEPVLEDIETVVVVLRRRQPELSDWNVDAVYQALQRTYRAESEGRAAPAVKLSPLENTLYSQLAEVCAEWLQLKPDKKISGAGAAPGEPALTTQDIQDCFKVLRSSIKLWSKNFGRTGYLDFVEQFIAQDAG